MSCSEFYKRIRDFGVCKGIKAQQTSRTGNLISKRLLHATWRRPDREAAFPIFNGIRANTYHEPPYDQLKTQNSVELNISSRSVPATLPGAPCDIPGSSGILIESAPSAFHPSETPPTTTAPMVSSAPCCSFCAKPCSLECPTSCNSLANYSAHFQSKRNSILTNYNDISFISLEERPYNGTPHASTQANVPLAFHHQQAAGTPPSIFDAMPHNTVLSPAVHRRIILHQQTHPRLHWNLQLAAHVHSEPNNPAFPWKRGHFWHSQQRRIQTVSRSNPTPRRTNLRSRTASSNYRYGDTSTTRVAAAPTSATAASGTAPAATATSKVAHSSAAICRQRIYKTR